LNTNILHTDIQDFIFDVSTTIDLTSFILSGSPFSDITVQELAQQISGRYTAKAKLPFWCATRGIYYPPSLHLEQTSSEVTALYKSKLVSGDVLIDLTGGFGIDEYYFSKKIKRVIHCELNVELSTIAAHNFNILAATNIITIAGNGLEILQHQNAIDWIYIDPSRRHTSKGKVFFLEDCLPNVPKHLDALFYKSRNVLLKTSPLLDIRSGLRSLKYVKEVHVVAVQNEVKELLWVLERDINCPVIIYAVNLMKDQSVEFSFVLEEENKNIPVFSLPQKYLYEPNASILKSGGFCSIATTYEVHKLHANTHLYTSDKKIKFPGRRFEVVSVLPYQKKIMKREKIVKANITTRNFTESVADIRKKFKIKDGGDCYLFFTTNCNQDKIVLVCNKI